MRKPAQPDSLFATCTPGLPGGLTERKYRLALKAAGLWEGAIDELPEMAALRAAVQQAHAIPEPNPRRASTADPWRAEIEEAIAKGVGPQALYDRLRRQKVEGLCSLSALKRLHLRIRREKGPRPQDVAIPVISEPGDIAQVDFGYVGKLYDSSTGKVRKAWAFVMVLGHSRHLFARVVFEQTTHTWLNLHVAAFRWFGGVPRTVVPDNLKAAVIRAAFGLSDRNELALNLSYRELARFYGFKIDPTPAYAPTKKGKVESAVKYVKSNFIAAAGLETLDEVNNALPDWVSNIAGTRQHRALGTTPLDAFEREKPQLLALPAQSFRPVEWKKYTVHPDSHIQFDRRIYSVPWKLIGKQLWVRATPDTVYVFHDDIRIATHERRGIERRVTDDAHLPEGRRDLRYRSVPYWKKRAQALGPEVGAYIDAVFNSDGELSKLRDVQAIVTLLEGYPPHRRKDAVERARFFGLYAYQNIKRILVQALDREPLPTWVEAQSTDDVDRRFARSADQFLATTLPKSDDECH